MLLIQRGERFLLRARANAAAMAEFKETSYVEGVELSVVNTVLLRNVFDILLRLP